MNPRLIARWWPCAAVLFAFAGCAPKVVAPEPIRAVRTMVVGEAGSGSPHDYAAEIRARTESRLSFRVGGKLATRLVNSGDTVRAGQLLARLDPTDLRLGLDAASAAQRAAQTNLEQLEADFRRYRELREQGFIGPAELERRDAAVKAARAQLEQANAQASAQGNQAAYASLVADSAGVITAVEAEPGQVLAAGTPVLKLAQDGPRDAQFSVPEDVVDQGRALLGKPDAARLQLWGAAATTPATLREVAGAADPVTRTFLVKADVGRAAVRLGQTATLRLPGLPAASGLRLPLTAVFEAQGRSHVWVFSRAEGAVRMQAVQIAGADGNTVLVLQGLRAGEEVVVAGTHVLTPGQKVRPYVEPAQSASVPAAAASH
jgi:multidrug efflux system membrane fusion protein